MFELQKNGLAIYDAPRDVELTSRLHIEIQEVVSIP